MRLTAKQIFPVLVVINLLNYIDRGVIPGATNEFDSFIQGNLNTGTPDVYLGMLQSSFIVGYIIGSFIFGHLIHYYPRFLLTGIGCSIWTVAVFMAGLSYYANSYVFLLFARMISGFGEAGLQCSVPPWIQNEAPENSKGTWLAIFYTCIPVGTALGYAYSSIVASSALGWGWAFLFESIIIVPFLFFLFAIAPLYPCETHKDSAVVSALLDDFNHDDQEASEQPRRSHHTDSDIDIQGPPTFFEECKIVLTNPVFLCITAGYASQTATLMGISTFGSAFLMGLGFFNSETEASTTFGLLISFAGVIATPLGGWLLDYVNRPIQERTYSTNTVNNARITNNMQLGNNLWIITVSSAAGTILLCVIYDIYDKYLFLAVTVIGCCMLFLCNAGINMGVMMSVPDENRSIAIGINCAFIHLLGDVPSPILTGLIKDSLAPGCISESSDDKDAAASPDCRADADGLRTTLLLLSLWLIWSVLFFYLGWFVNRASYGARKAIGSAGYSSDADTEDSKDITNPIRAYSNDETEGQSRNSRGSSGSPLRSSLGRRGDGNESVNSKGKSRSSNSPFATERDPVEHNVLEDDVVSYYMKNNLLNEDILDR